MQVIKFGTSGWRDIIAENFTFSGVKALTRAVARQLKKNKKAKLGVLVGHDPRFLAEEFSQCAADILCEEGIDVTLIQEATPTPVLATVIRNNKLAGGVNFTASHNPALYQGYKWSNQFGGPATKDEVGPIEKEANQILSKEEDRKPKGVKKGRIRLLDPKKAYFKLLTKIVDLSVIKKAKLSVVADPLFGAGRGYLDEALKMAGCHVDVLHDWRDPLFGGFYPEPNAEHLKEATEVMKKKRAKLVLGTDGDADRFGVVDGNGNFITPNEVLALTVYLLVKHRGMKGRVVRSVVTSHLVDAVASIYDLPVEVTPVGFKYIGESMNRGGFLVGGEESGGLTIVGHVPEKDGILACLLMVELVAREKKSLTKILERIYKEVGLLLTDRVNVKLATLQSGKMLKKKLALFKPQRLAGKKVVKVDRMDGFKFILEDNSWFAIRLSGTEPVARLYLEATNVAMMKKMIVEGKKLLANT